MAKTSNHYVLILCGGSGPRLWPLSHASYPKPFLKLFGPTSLLQETVARFTAFLPAKNIYIVSNHKFLKDIKKQIGQTIPQSNFIIEPEKKNTAMAILYATAIIKKINPQAVITATPSDHFITLPKNFQIDIQKVAKIARDSNTIVTIGTLPTYPNPAFGYIIPATKQGTYYPVLKFIEKPSVVEAQIFIKKDAYWNSGIYTYQINTLLNQFSILQPDYYALYLKLEKNIDKPQTIAQIFKLSPNLSIDQALAEKSSSLSMIVAKFHWSDIGEWKSIFEQLTKNQDGIATINKHGLFISLNSKNCLIHGDNNKLIGLLGVNNLAIIDTSDSLLVCNLNDSYSVRDLVSKIVADPKLIKYFLSHHDQ